VIGPIRFVYAIIWFAIGLSTVGVLKDCTMLMAARAAKANQGEVLSLKSWNAILVRE
jgi:hypothetical protein